MAEPEKTPNVREVESRIREEFLAPLIEATTVAFREVVKSEIVVQIQWESNTLDLDGGCTFAVEQQYLNGNGRMYLNVPSSAVMEIARRMLSEVNQEIDDRLADDCLGEVLNVVAGQGKALLSQSRWHYSFSTPRFVTNAFPTDKPGMWLVATFQSEFGPIRLIVNAVENEQN